MRPPRLRTVLLLSNLAALALPLAGLWAGLAAWLGRRCDAASHTQSRP